jgi:hypothetical protein
MIRNCWKSWHLFNYTADALCLRETRRFITQMVKSIYD